MDYWKLLEPFWRDVSVFDGTDVFLTEFAKLPAPIQHLFAAEWAQYQVCNGGFHQLFWNSAGVLAPEAVAGFSAIGMPSVAQLVRDAMERLAVPFPRDRQERHDLLELLTGGQHPVRVEVRRSGRSLL